MALSILVCIKAVPDMSAGHPRVIDGDKLAQSDIDWCMNGYDACALEAALATREAHPHTTVEALSAGPEHVRPILRRTMAMGADAGIHLSLEASCEMEGGMSERIRLALPAVVTVRTGGWQPRYPTLSNSLRSRKQPIRRVDADRIKAGRTRTLGLAPAASCRIVRETLSEKTTQGEINEDR
jgi:electron transfer flavoprotein alpha/beta subunit